MRKFIKGNDAVTIGAIYAGCDAYFGYPITPASEIAHTAALYFPPLGKEFLQAECETAAINMMYGAAAAGKLSMTASSGPGVSLMQEGMSYLAGAQLPAVIVNVMRTGPGLGNIGPEQGDYNQAVKGGGHGNYRTIVLAPNSVQEMCDLTIKCFELSMRYRNPALLLADAVLGQMMESLTVPKDMLPREDFTSWSVRGDSETRNNLVCSIYLEPDLQEDHNWMLQEKYALMQCETMSESYLCEDADLILTGYGSCSRICRSAVDALRSDGYKVGLFRPVSLYPFPEEELNDSVGSKDVLVVELSNGQYRDDVRLHLRACDSRIGLANRMGGNLISVEEVKAKARDILEGVQ